MAVADPSLQTVFNGLDSASAKAYAKVGANEKRSRASSRSEAQKEEDAAVKNAISAFRKIRSDREASERREVQGHQKSEEQKNREVKRSEEIRSRIRDNTLRRQQSDREAAERKETRDHERKERDKSRQVEREERVRARIRDTTLRQEERDQKTQDRKSAAERSRGARDFGKSVVSDLSRMGRGVIGGIGEISRGAGIDASVSGLTGSVIKTETSAMHATQSGMMAQGKTATKSDVADTLKTIHSAGDATALSYGSMADALERLTSHTGDLALSKGVLGDLGKLANASGGKIEELADAAGGLAFNMTGYGTSAEEAARKQADLMEMMGVLTKQGSTGAVEMKDMATYIPKIASAARLIGGDRKAMAEQLGPGATEGQITAAIYKKNMGQLGGIAQESMKGGEATAPGAILAAQKFVTDLMKSTNLKKLDKEGIDIWEDKEHHKTRSAQDIILATYAKTNGDQAMIAKLFNNVHSAAALRGFSETYNEAGGGEAGLKAIQAVLKSYEGGLSKEEINSGNDLYKDSKAGKAQDVQNKFETAWSAALEKLTPALERLTPHIGELADAFVKIVSWAASNPGEAITAAIVGSILKAAIGNAVMTAITNSIKGGGGPGGGGGAGALAPAAAIASVGLAVDQYQKLAEEQARDGRDTFDLSDPTKANKTRGDITELDLIKKHMSGGDVEWLQRQQESDKHQWGDSIFGKREKEKIDEKFGGYIKSAGIVRDEKMRTDLPSLGAAAVAAATQGALGAVATDRAAPGGSGEKTNVTDAATKASVDATKDAINHQTTAIVGAIGKLGPVVGRHGPDAGHH